MIESDNFFYIISILFDFQSHSIAMDFDDIGRIWFW